MLKLKIDDLTVEITNRCCLHCRWCDIWREQDLNEISLVSLTATVEKLQQSFRINGISITGGEPFLHPDIAGILKTLALWRAQRRISSFGVYSSGACPDIIDKILKKDAPILSGMDIGISIDGLEKTHDMLRGRGAYRQTWKTLRRLYRGYSGMFDVELKFTANGLNCHELYDVYELACAHGFRFTPKVVESHVPAYYHRGAGGQRPESQGDHFFPVLRDQILRILRQEAYAPVGVVQPKMLKILLRLVEEGSGVIRVCKTPARTFFITSRGDVYPCLYMSSAGSIDPESLCSPYFFEQRTACIVRGAKADCSGCSSYHGFLKSFNTLSRI